MVVAVGVVVVECLHVVQAFACNKSLIMGAIMLCRNPFVRDPTGAVFHAPASLLFEHGLKRYDGVPFPCGQCLPCRINKRRYWTHRLILEALLHDRAAFITLTYAPENYPEDGNLSKRDVQLWLKRLRKLASPRKLRFYAVGEYGAQTHRAHYHAIVFGIDEADTPLVEQSWPFGHVFVAECNRLTIQYVVGYVTKKHIKKDNPDGRIPEFALMSLRPAIGSGALEQLSTLIDRPEYKHLFEGDDIPDGLRHGNVFLPFDRFSRNKLMQFLHRKSRRKYDYLRQVIEDFDLKQSESKNYGKLYVDILKEESKQRNLQIDRKNRIFNQRNSI